MMQQDIAAYSSSRDCSTSSSAACMIKLLSDHESDGTGAPADDDHIADRPVFFEQLPARAVAPALAGSPPNDLVSTPGSPPPTSANGTINKKRKRRLAGTPDADAEVIALTPKKLLESDRYVCEICTKGFQRDQNLQMHKRRHKVPWTLLKRGSTTAAAANSTNEVQQQRKRVYVCPEESCLHHNACHALGDLVGIRKHYRRKHSTEKQWQCTKCSKEYAVQSDYKAHQKTCGTRGHSCDCGRVFSRVEGFIEHHDKCMALLAKEKAAAAAVANSGDISRTPESCTDHHSQMSADIQQQQLMSGWNLMTPALEYAEAPRDFQGSVQEKYAAAAWSAAAPSRQCLAGIEEFNPVRSTTGSCSIAATSWAESRRGAGGLFQEMQAGPFLRAANSHWSPMWFDPARFHDLQPGSVNSSTTNQNYGTLATAAPSDHQPAAAGPCATITDQLFPTDHDASLRLSIGPSHPLVEVLTPAKLSREEQKRDLILIETKPKLDMSAYLQRIRSRSCVDPDVENYRLLPPAAGREVVLDVSAAAAAAAGSNESHAATAAGRRADHDYELNISARRAAQISTADGYYSSRIQLLQKQSDYNSPHAELQVLQAAGSCCNYSSRPPAAAGITAFRSLAGAAGEYAAAAADQYGSTHETAVLGSSTRECWIPNPTYNCNTSTSTSLISRSSTTSNMILGSREVSRVPDQHNSTIGAGASGPTKTARSLMLQQYWISPK